MWLIDAAREALNTEVHEEEDWHYEKQNRGSEKTDLLCACGKHVYYTTILFKNGFIANELFCTNCGLQMRSPGTDKDGEWLKKHWVEVLKTQGPRVMTLDEVAEWHRVPALQRVPIYVEYLPNSGLGISGWVLDYFGFNPNSYPNKNSGYYRKWLRCWTSKPTDEQREAEPWNS